jgi:hypothetical protein
LQAHKNPPSRTGVGFKNRIEIRACKPQYPRAVFL